MMYTAFLLCLMIVIPFSWADGNVCLKRIATPPSQDSCVPANTCDPGYHMGPSGCVGACDMANYGSTFQYYCGIDVRCQFEENVPEATTLETCVTFCAISNTCISGSFNVATSSGCVRHKCDYQGDTHPLFQASLHVESIDDAAPGIRYFVKNCAAS